MTKTLIQWIACTIEALHNCQKTENQEWISKHNATLLRLEKLLPSGSGIDAGTYIQGFDSTVKKITLKTSFHHMDEHGHYNGWTDHDVIVTPAFDGIDMRITGKDRNQVKDNLYDTYSRALEATLSEDQVYE